ncbi:MAG TPA: 2OG-Fe(II) oxygenase [Chloroflexota bacterium]|nr:2OG-Fe(II) oxygenase [Chloroflexota bacterium]
MGTIAGRVERLDWAALEQSLDAFGYATTGPLLTGAECETLVELYQDEARFRSRVDMARYGFGSGEYKYLSRPLPELVEELRTSFYPCLAPIASRWAEALGDPTYPPELADFLEVCAQHGQTRPTPLILKYEAGDYNCLHQDLYGDVAFPIQMTFALSRRGEDYTGGEFLLLEQRPRAQSRGQAVTLEQGEAVIFTTRYRPVRGSRGWYRMNLRHGVSRLLSGRRFTLGIIFHDAR